MKFSYDIINYFIILFFKKKFPRGKEAKIISIQICNKHQEDTFNYKRRKHIYEKKNPSSFIFLCVLKGRETLKIKTYINVSLVNVDFFLISLLHDFSEK
jgi:hypothetical protein